MPLPAFGLDETVVLQPSKILFGWIVLSTVATAGLAWAYLPLWYGLCVALGSAGFAVYAVSHHALLKRQESITALRFGHNGLSVRQRNGNWHAASEDRFSISGLVGPALIVIRLNSERMSARHTIVLLIDSLDPVSARRLRVWLRWMRDNAPNAVAE